MPRPASDIPVGTQFSPNLINLPAFLSALVAKSGDKVGIEEAVWSPEVRTRAKVDPPTRRNRSLPVEAAVQYGLLTSAYEVSPLARRLVLLAPRELHEEFAKHILLNCGGLRVVEGAMQMELDNLNVTGDTLAQYLTDQGFRVTVHNTAINSLRMWLELAGVFGKDSWKVSHGRVQNLLGLGRDQVAALAGLNEEQRAFIEALCRINPEGRYEAASVRLVAAQVLGHSFGQESLPKAVLDPLKRAGLIDYDTKGTKGGKSAVLWTLPSFKAEVLEPFVRRTVKTLDVALAAYYTKRPADIYAEMRSDDKFVKGQALEAFAIQIMRLLGLRFVAWRKRARDTGGAELDVVMSGVIGIVVPTVWQIQCKNTPAGYLSLEDVSREVGLVPMTRATHILILANCRIAGEAESFAKQIMRDQSLTIFIIGKEGFERIQSDPHLLVSILHEQAEAIAHLRSSGTSR
jgi:hypothetical protein